MVFNKAMVRPMLFEFAGTLLFAFTVYGGARIGGSLGVYMGLTYLGLSISQACFDPAVTLAVLLSGDLPGEGWKGKAVMVGLYALAQVLGGILGAMLGYLSLPEDSIVCLQPDDDKYNVLENFCMLTIVSMFVSFVVLSTAHTKDNEGNQYFGLAAGLALLLPSMTGVVSHPSANPAITVGSLIANSIVKPEGNTCSEDNWKHVWWYATFPFLGAFLAWCLHRLTNPSQSGGGKLGKLSKFAPFIMEGIGAMFFAFAYGAAIFVSEYGTVGFVFAALIYAGGHVSGAQFNPTISLAMFVRGAQELKRTLIFIGVQCLGALLGSCLIYLLSRYGEDSSLESPGVVHPALASKEDEFAGFLAEFGLAFIVVVVVMTTVAWEQTASNWYFGLIIGYTYIATMIAGGNSVASAFNPAIWLSANLFHGFHDSFDDFKYIWIYLIGDCLAAVAGAFAFLYFTEQKRGNAAIIPK